MDMSLTMRATIQVTRRTVVLLWMTLQKLLKTRNYSLVKRKYQDKSYKCLMLLHMNMYQQVVNPLRMH